MTIDEAMAKVRVARIATRDAEKELTDLITWYEGMTPEPPEPPIPPDPEPPEPPGPDPEPLPVPIDFTGWNPAGMADEHKQGFRWKPISESDRKLVILAALAIPIDHVRVVYVVAQNGTVHYPRWSGISNGRHTWRFEREGEQYGNFAQFVMLGINGSVYRWEIADTSAEGYPNNCPVTHLVPPPQTNPDPRPPGQGWIAQQRGLFFHEARQANDWGVPNAISLSVHGRQGAVGNSQRPILWLLHRYQGWEQKQSLEKVYANCMYQMSSGGCDGVALNWETWTLDYGVDMLKTMYRAAVNNGKFFIACPKVDGAPGGRYPEGARSLDDVVAMCTDYTHGITPWLYSMGPDGYVHYHTVWSRTRRHVWMLGDASRYGPATGGGFYTGLQQWIPSARKMAALGHPMGMFIPYHAAQHNPEALRVMKELWTETG